MLRLEHGEDGDNNGGGWGTMTERSDAAVCACVYVCVCGDPAIHHDDDDGNHEQRRAHPLVRARSGIATRSRTLVVKGSG